MRILKKTFWLFLFFSANLHAQSKLDQVITFNLLQARAFGGANFDLDGSASSGLQISFTSSDPSVASVSGNTVVILKAGSTIITASQAGNESYNAAPEVQQTLTIEKASPTITWDPPSDITYGDVLSTNELNATANVEGIFVYTPAIGTRLNAGSDQILSVVFTPTDQINYTEKTEEVTIYVEKADQVISLGENAANGLIQPKTFGDSPFTIVAESSSGLPITLFSSSDDYLATFIEDKVSILGAGSVTLQAFQEGDDNYNEASGQVTFTIAKATPIIAWNNPADIVYGTALSEMEFNATSAVEGTYVYNPDIGTLLSGGNQQKLTVTFNPAVQENYVSISKEVFINVLKADQTLTIISPEPKSYGDEPFSFYGEASSGLPITYTSLDVNKAVIMGELVKIVGAGSVTIDITQSGNENFNAVSRQEVFIIEKATPNIVFNAPEDIMYGERLSLRLLAPSANVPGTFSLEPAIGTLLDAGNYEDLSLVFTPAEPSNYNIVKEQFPLTVYQFEQTLIFGESSPNGKIKNKRWGDAPFKLVGLASSGLSISYSSSDETKLAINGDIATIIGLGPVTIYAYQEGNNNYTDAVAEIEINIEKGLPDILWPNLPDIVYGTTLGLTQLNATCNLEGNFVYDFEIGTKLNAGNQKLSVTFTPIDLTHYEVVSKQVTLTVLKASPEITWSNPAHIVYGATLDGNQLNATASVQGTFAYAPAAGTKLNAGNQKLSVTFKPIDELNYNSLTKEILINVTKADQAINFGILDAKTFGDASFELIASVSSALPLTYSSSNELVATVTGKLVTIKGAGTTIITAKQSGNDNYNSASDLTQPLTINKANQTIAFGALDAKAFGDADFILTSQGGGSANVITYSSSNSLVASITENRVKINGAGTAMITAKQQGNDNYNDAPEVTQVLLVNKANQTIAFGALDAKTFGDADFILTSQGGGSANVITYSSSNSLVASITENRVKINGAGTAIITARQAGNDNYQAAPEVTQALLINKANQTIAFGPLGAKTFGDASFDLTASASSGLPINYSTGNELVAKVSGNSILINGAGNTTITAKQGGNDNYNAAADLVQVLAVNKATQTITFGNLDAKTFGDSDFVLNAAGGASGNAITFVSSNALVATIADNKLKINGAGTTTITAKQAGNENYTAAPDVIRTLTVNKKNQEIIFTSLSNKTLGGASFGLVASSNSTLPVSFATTSDKISISANQVAMIKSGRVIITASQVGNENYNAAPAVNQSFCVNPAKPIITLSNLNSDSPILTSNALAGNQWYLENAALAGATNSSFTAKAQGTYKVQVTVDDCVSEFSQEQKLIITGDIAPDLKASAIGAYPNPVSDLLTITLGEEIGKKEILLFDLTGRCVFRKQVEGGQTELDVSAYAQGIYIIKIQTESRIAIIHLEKL